MSEQMPKVLVIGYSPQLPGGVVKVTDTLYKSYPSMDLHVFHHCYTPKIRALGKFFSSLLKFAFRLGKLRKSYDVLHIIVGSSGDAVRTLPYIWLGKLARMPICIQHHKSSDIVERYLPKLLPKRLISCTWQNVDAHVFLSERLKASFEHFFIECQQLFVIPNAIPEEWIDSETVGSLHDRPRDIVFFGRWSWEKGVEDLVQVVDQLAGGVDCDCYTNVLTKTTEGQCRLYPWVSEKEVKAIIKTAKLLILPSYSEAFPTVLLESCASGTPFAASNIAGIPDIAEQSGAGVIFKPGDIQDIVKAVNNLMNNPEKWQEMALSGKQWAAKLSPKIIRNEWQVLYESIVK